MVGERTDSVETKVQSFTSLAARGLQYCGATNELCSLCYDGCAVYLVCLYQIR